MGYTVRQDQEHTVTREHAGGRGGRLLGKSKILSLTVYYSTTLLLRQRSHTLHTSGRRVDSEMDTFTHLGVPSLPFCLWRKKMEEVG